MELASLFLFILISAINYRALRNVPWFLPLKLFITFNLVMGGGILAQLDFGIQADQAHAVTILGSALMYFPASVYFAGKAKFGSLVRDFPLLYDARRAASDFQFSLGFFIVSGLMVAIYFALLGRNVFLTALTSSLSTSDVVDMRLESYAGENYYAPGYFNQFKNILFPASYLAVSYYVWKLKSRRALRMTVIVMLFLPVILGLVGTGQRGYLFSFLVAALVFIGAIRVLGGGRSGVKFRTAASIFLTFFALFSTSSLLLGRSENASVFDFGQALAVRIFNDNQYAAVVGYRYIYDQDVQYGAEWLTDILGILPGPSYRGSDLPNRIHAIIYGSDRGTAPVSMWGSVFHNWGWIGVVFFPILLAKFYSWLSRSFLRLKSLTILSVSGYAYLFFIFGGWVASGPMQLINNGAITAVLLILLAGYWRFRIRI